MILDLKFGGIWQINNKIIFENQQPLKHAYLPWRWTWTYLRDDDINSKKSFQITLGVALTIKVLCPWPEDTISVFQISRWT